MRCLLASLVVAAVVGTTAFVVGQHWLAITWQIYINGGPLLS